MSIKITPREYEYKPDGSMSEAAEKVIADLKACARLGIPFSVKTVRKRQFRHGGNVFRAEVELFYVEIGQVEEIENP